MTDAHRCRCAAPPRGRSCSTWASSPRRTTSLRPAIPAPTPPTRCRCGCAPPAGWRSCWSTPRCPRSRRAAEPAALVEQAADAVGRVAAAGWLPAAGGPPSTAAPTAARGWTCWPGGLTVVATAAEAEVVLDCFGLMHSADQAAALAERAARVAPGGVLLLQYHSLGTIVRLGQWNSLRHGHYAYYSTAALDRMLASVGFVARQAWRFDLYGGTILLAATRAEGDGGGAGPDTSVTDLVAEETALGWRTRRGSAPCRTARHPAPRRSTAGWPTSGRREPACSATGPRRGRWRCCAGRASTAALLPAVADASPAKHGRRMPATDIPVVAPSDLVAARPDAVALFLPDLLPEMRATLPEVEAAGGRWVDVEALGATPAADAATQALGMRGLRPW